MAWRMVLIVWLDFGAHGYEAHAIQLASLAAVRSDRPVNAYRIPR
jgi:hypothetical protein